MIDPASVWLGAWELSWASVDDGAEDRHLNVEYRIVRTTASQSTVRLLHDRVSGDGTTHKVRVHGSLREVLARRVCAITYAYPFQPSCATCSCIEPEEKTSDGSRTRGRGRFRDVPGRA